MILWSTWAYPCHFVPTNFITIISITTINSIIISTVFSIIIITFLGSYCTSVGMIWAPLSVQWQYLSLLLSSTTFWVLLASLLAWFQHPYHHHRCCPGGCHIISILSPPISFGLIFGTQIITIWSLLPFTHTPLCFPPQYLCWPDLVKHQFLLPPLPLCSSTLLKLSGPLCFASQYCSHFILALLKPIEANLTHYPYSAITTIFLTQGKKLTLDGWVA